MQLATALGADSLWLAATPWWATVLIAFATTASTVVVMRLNNRAALGRDFAKLRADDQRRDRQTAAAVQAASDNFSLALRRYYETWLVATQEEAEDDQEVVDASRVEAQRAVSRLQESLRAASLTLSSQEMVASGERLDQEAQELLRKISLYERGLAFRLHGPGSIDLLFSGFDGELDAFMAEARRILHSL